MSLRSDSVRDAMNFDRDTKEEKKQKRIQAAYRKKLAKKKKKR